METSKPAEAGTPNEVHAAKGFPVGLRFFEPAPTGGRDAERPRRHR